MAVRSDRRRRYSTRADYQTQGTGHQATPRGNFGQLESHDINFSPVPPHEITMENVVHIVRLITETIESDISQELQRIGRYINESGEISKLSKTLMDQLDARYAPPMDTSTDVNHTH